MDEQKWLAEKFETHRAHLSAVAYRMLGSLSEADDAVQEAWLRLSRTDTSGVENLGGWLTTVVARVCLDMLRSRQARREQSLSAQVTEPVADRTGATNPEQEALLADSVGLALLVVLNTLAPAERIAFVLHDVFAVSFDEIASIVDRSPEATRQLASRARRRVQGTNDVPDAALSRQREVVNAFLAASRHGDFEALLTLLDPDVVFWTDRAAAKLGGPKEVRGASTVARLFSGKAQLARPMLIDGAVGIVVAPQGRLFLALLPVIEDGKIIRLEAIADAERLRHFTLSVLPE